METTTVWIFPENKFEQLVNKNIVERYGERNTYKTISLVSGLKQSVSKTYKSHKKKMNLLFIKSPYLNSDKISLAKTTLYLKRLKNVISREIQFIDTGGHCVIQTRDVRIRGYVEPLAKCIVDCLDFDTLSLKEIVVITTETHKDKKCAGPSNLQLAHQYLLIYKKVE